MPFLFKDKWMLAAMGPSWSWELCKNMELFFEHNIKGVRSELGEAEFFQFSGQIAIWDNILHLSFSWSKRANQRLPKGKAKDFGADDRKGATKLVLSSDQRGFFLLKVSKWLSSCLIQFTSLKICIYGRWSFDLQIYLDRKARWALLPGVAARRMARTRKQGSSSGRLILPSPSILPSRLLYTPPYKGWQCHQWKLKCVKSIHPKKWFWNEEHTGF